VPDSGALYRGRRDHLPFATIGDAPPRANTNGAPHVVAAEASR
jgi:hypothetical protein